MASPSFVLARKILQSRSLLSVLLMCSLITDNGNYIIDLRVPQGIDNPEEVDREIKNITGVVDHGLFINMATTVIVASKEGIKVLTK